MSPIFPQEIESEILVRLPAKSVHRCKSVCKSWNSLINSDTNFISNFNRHAAKKPKLLFLKHPCISLIPIHFSLAVSENRTLIETTTLHLPNNIIGLNSEIKTITRIDLINSNLVNGVLGIIVYIGLVNGPVVECDMYMWNVGTNETVKLPVSGVTRLLNGPPMVKFYCGFGYDKTGFDYKIVRVVCLGSIRLKCEVFCLSKNCWRKLKFNGDITSNTLWASEMCTFIDGIGYWGVYKSESKDGFSVLGFNFVDERFKKIMVPEECVDGREKKYQGLWEYRGDLALSVLRFGEFESGFSRHYVWLFKQCGEDEGFSCSCSWSSLFNIDLECGPRRPVVSLMTGELVLLGGDDGEHVVFDRVCGQVKSLSVCDVDHVLLYVEGLVSLRSLLPKEASSSLLPEETDSSLLPEEADTSLLLGEGGTSLLPKEAQTSSWSKEASNSLLPKEAKRFSWSNKASSGLWSEEASSSLLPNEPNGTGWSEVANSSLMPKQAKRFSWLKEAGSNLLPNEASSGLWSEEASSSLLPNEANFIGWSEDASSSLFPEEACRHFWLEEASSGLLPEEAISSLLLKEASSRLFPEEASSSLLPEEDSSSLLSEEASSSLLSEQANSSLLPEEAITPSSCLLPEDAINSLLVREDD